MGSGSLPTQNLATRLVAIQSDTIESGELAARLRRSAPPVFARVHQGQVLLDPRTVLDDEEPLLVEAVIAAMQQSRD
jgi:L-seryl-tRNA(Ser) seleniumtransferase